MLRVPIVEGCDEVRKDLSSLPSRLTVVLRLESHSCCGTCAALHQARRRSPEVRTFVAAGDSAIISQF